MMLNSVMFYKTKFTITRKNPEEDLLWKIILHLRRWQTGKWNRDSAILTEELYEWSRLKTGASMESIGKTVYIASEYLEENGLEAWACRICENARPQPGFADRQWNTEVGFEQLDENSAEFSCVVSYCDRAGFIGPYMEAPVPTVPGIISRIVEDQTIRVSAGSDILPKGPCCMEPGQWPEFYERICDPDRELPYIYISPRCEQEAGETLLVNPERLARCVYGNALVFYALDPDFSREIHSMNPDYDCYNGAIRVYQPHADTVFRHRYLKASVLKELGEEGVLDFMRRAFSANINFYETFFTMEECQKRRSQYRTRQRIASIKNQHSEEVDWIYQTALEEEEAKLQAEKERDELKQEVSDLQTDLYTVEAQLTALRPSFPDSSTLKKAAKMREMLPKLPKTVDEVITYFRDVFADRLIFSDEALKSAKKCTLPPEQLWESFYALATEMWQLAFHGEGDIYAQFRSRTGIECGRGEGKQTRANNRLMRQFQIRLEDEVIDIEPHITASRLRQSIHFGFSQKQQRVVIGHCGEHLEIHSSRGQK